MTKNLSKKGEGGTFLHKLFNKGKETFITEQVLWQEKQQAFFSCHYKDLEKQRTFEVQFSIEVTLKTTNYSNETVWIMIENLQFNNSCLNLLFSDSSVVTNTKC